jgi:hypothetical protein
MITQSSNTDITDRSLELDERVSSVVWVRRAGFAASAKVGIVADSALVPIALNIRLYTVSWVAKRSVAVDAVVTSLTAV